MSQAITTQPAMPYHSARPSPLQLADRLLTLAQDADRAGHGQAAVQLLALVDVVLDHNSARPH